MFTSNLALRDKHASLKNWSLTMIAILAQTMIGKKDTKNEIMAF